MTPRNITIHCRPDENDIMYIFKNIWKLTGSYRLASNEKLDETSIWYVMDEFGSAIQHSDTPNGITAPFLFAPNNKLDAYTISYNVMLIVRHFGFKLSLLIGTLAGCRC